MNSMLTLTTTKLRPPIPAYTACCGACGYQNPARIDFCLNCANPLGPVCPACGETIETGSRFCGKCGGLLTDSRSLPQVNPGQEVDQIRNLLGHMPSALAQKISTASVKQHGERRNVTVLQVGLDDVAMNANGMLDGEHFYLLIDKTIALLADVARKYNGTIDKFTGNGLMVLFGVPAAHENDPELAIRSAVDMLSTIQPLSQHSEETFGFQLQLRIGISTGEAIAGRMGSNLHMEYTVIGDSVNLAAHLKKATAPGTILVCEETYKRASAVFEFETVSPALNSGYLAVKACFRPLKVLDRSDQALSLTNPQLLMVGRADELTRLEKALEIVHQDNQRRIIRLGGEAGIGKSRLIAEFQKNISSSGSRIYQSGCPVYARSHPFSMVAGLVRRIIGLVETDSTGIQHETIQHYLSQMNLSETEIWPYLACVLGLEQANQAFETRLALLDRTMLQRQIHVALRQLFMAEARQAPVVIILEDLQWIDPASYKFLEYLLQTTSDTPLMLVLVSRLAEHDQTFSLLQSVLEMEPDQLVDLQLEPLSPAEQELLVDQFISRNAIEGQVVRGKIIQKGQGNPFYLGELIRMLIDKGGLKQDSSNQVWQVTPQASELITATPGTIKDLILARFDCLPEELRRTLQLAAVLGNTFTAGLLQKIGGLNAETLAFHLKELKARQFISTSPATATPDYSFQHILFQEVIYSTLLKRDCRLIHDQVAQAIEQNESVNGDDKVVRLAYHYFEGTQPIKAVQYLLTSANKAALQSAHEIAIERYRRVMSLLPDEPNGHNREFFQARLGLGRSLKYIGELSAGGQLLRESLPQLWHSDLATQSATLWPILVELLRQLADIHQRQGTYDEALDYLDTGLQVLGDAGAAENPRLWCQLVERQAWIQFRQGRLEQGFALANSAVERLSLEKIDDPIMLAKLLNTLGGISWQQGDRQKAIDYTRRSLELFQTMGYTWGVATAQNNLGILYDVLGHWPKGIEYHQQAYALQRNIGDIEGQARSLDNLGILHMMMGEHRTARQELEASLTIRQRLGDRYGMAQTHASLAELALIKQAHQEALTNGEAALNLADAIESSEIQVYARWVVALAQTEQEGIEPSLALVKEALEMARRDGFAEGEIDCLRVMGVLRAKLGENQEAQALFHNSAQLAQQYKDPYRQGVAILESGLAYMSLVGDNDKNQLSWQAKAVAAFNAATEIFDPLGAVHHQYLIQSALKQLRLDDPIEG